MKKTLAAAGTTALVLAPAGAAWAGGSDDPTPYTVTADGLTLPAPEVFRDGGHVNIKYTVDGQQEDASIHFESLNNQPSGAWIGKSSLRWSALIDEADYCITWVQVSDYNEHFGEGGQDPVCTTDESTDEPTEVPTEEPEVPTEEPTEEPAEEPTEVPTEEPTEELETPDPTEELETPLPTENPAATTPADATETDDTDGSTGGPADTVVAPDAEDAATAEADPQAEVVHSQTAGELPQTGATVTGFLVAAAALVLSGAGFVVLRRRRTS
jgi:LPXTG-motif cell wall-anchored protein